MKTALIRIGNSQGIRIPKTVIEQCALDGELEMIVRNNYLVITAKHGRRRGWEAAFARMAATNDDAALLPDNLASNWDDAEWKW